MLLFILIDYRYKFNSENFLKIISATGLIFKGNNSGKEYVF